MTSPSEILGSLEGEEVLVAVVRRENMTCGVAAAVSTAFARKGIGDDGVKGAGLVLLTALYGLAEGLRAGTGRDVDELVAETLRAMLGLMGPEACDGLVRHAMAEIITAAALERAN